MFTLELENENNQIVNINDECRYVVTHVSGLNPPSASIYTSPSPNKKGSKYNSSYLNERNIEITIKLLGDIEVNRNILYDWVNTENYVKVRYSNGVKNVYCEGHVEECDIDFFTSNEVVVLSIICEDPFWKDLDKISKYITSQLNHFVFPFAIDEPIPFSTLTESTEIEIYHEGVETGIVIEIKTDDAIDGVRIMNTRDSAQNFTIKKPIFRNSIIVIDSESTPKTVKLYNSDGTVENIFKYTTNDTTWFKLKKGYNYFGYEVIDENGNHVDGRGSSIEIKISYNNKYLGV